MKSTHAFLIPFLCLIACGSGKSDSATSGWTQASSYGSIVTGPLEPTWQATRATLAELGGGFSANDATHEAQATISGALVSVKCETYDARKTILRIGADDAGVERQDIAESVQIAIQRRVLR